MFRLLAIGSAQDKLRSGLENYDEKQGKGFICWRFVLNEQAQAKVKQAQASGGAAAADLESLTDEVDV